MPKKTISIEQKLYVGQDLALLTAANLVAKRPWADGELAFQGGTAMHLVYGSPRWSEDLDFLVSQDVSIVDTEKLMQQVCAALQEHYLAADPQAEITLKSKGVRGDNLHVFWLKWSHPEVIGAVKTKIEIWRTPPEQLGNYEKNLESLHPSLARFRVAMLTPVPSASLSQIFADKVNALAGRRYIKWRDLFDMWWMNKHYSLSLDGNPVIAECMLASQAVHGDPMDEMAQRWERMAAIPDAEILAKAESDLQPFVPPAIWKQIKDTELQAMVALAKDQARLAAKRFQDESAEMNLQAAGSQRFTHSAGGSATVTA